jgi:hypothetical protein
LIDVQILKKEGLAAHVLGCAQTSYAAESATTLTMGMRRDVAFA